MSRVTAIRRNGMELVGLAHQTGSLRWHCGRPMSEAASTADWQFLAWK